MRFHTNFLSTQMKKVGGGAALRDFPPVGSSTCGNSNRDKITRSLLLFDLTLNGLAAASQIHFSNRWVINSQAIKSFSPRHCVFEGSPLALSPVSPSSSLFLFSFEIILIENNSGPTRNVSKNYTLLKSPLYFEGFFPPFWQLSFHSAAAPAELLAFIFLFSTSAN